MENYVIVHKRFQNNFEHEVPEIPFRSDKTKLFETFVFSQHIALPMVSLVDAVVLVVCVLLEIIRLYL